VTRYFDASALVKRYVREVGTTTVRRLVASGPIVTSRLSEIEVASGIARRTREGALTVKQRDRLLSAFERDLPAVDVVELIPEIATEARRLLLRHPLRAGDAVQLASCLYLQRQLAQVLPFVVFDHRLALAADGEGLVVVGRRPARVRRAGGSSPSPSTDSTKRFIRLAGSVRGGPGDVSAREGFSRK
jgi:predicted nucleic acid-binding protein